MTNIIFSPLQQRDVEIRFICHEGFTITTTNEKYQFVRNILTVLQEQEGLPLEYASENEGMKIAGISKIVFGFVPDFIIDEKDGLPPRLENHFVIPGYRKVGSNVVKMKALAEQVAEKLRTFQLKVEVNSESSIHPKMDEETEFVYTVMITSVALEVAKVNKNHPIWSGIPALNRITLMSGEFEAMRAMIAETPPVLQAVCTLFESYTEEVKNAIDTCENFKEEYDSNEPVPHISKLQLRRPTKEVMEMLKLLQSHHKS